ncbi:acylphosphatase [Pararhodobacter oceanensis]|uniref:acylphosphatase n=1 Tax=Pararhodobacter oceanensis TaxID=2172121 RepID=UPI003A95559D
MDFESGEFGTGGETLCAVELIYHGRLGADFVEFALNRARRLSLDGWISTVPEGVKVVAQGPMALVDSFEIVCSLGPIDSEITGWERSDIQAGLNHAGFVRR